MIANRLLDFAAKSKWGLLVGTVLTSVTVPSVASAQCVPNSGSCTLESTEDTEGEIYIEIPEGAANVVSLTNSATITGLVGISADEEELTLDSFTVVNTGTITGPAPFEDATLDIEAQHRSVSITNRGTIAQTVAPVAGARSGVAGTSIINEGGGVTNLTLSNSGTISATAYGSTALAIGNAPENDAETTAAPSVTVTNSGLISALGGAFFVVDPRFSDQGQFIGSQSGVEVAAGLAVGAAGVEGPSTVSITNSSTGVIEAGGALRLGRTFTSIGPNNFIPFLPTQGHIQINGAPDGVGMAALAVTGDIVTITNDGIIRGGEGTALPVGLEFSVPEIDSFYLNEETTITFPNRYLAGAIHSFGDGEDTIVNSSTGSIIGSIDLNGGNDRIDNRGTIEGDVFLRDGDDEFRHLITASFTGTADGGEGADKLIFDLTGGAFDSAILDQFTNFDATVFTGRARFSGNTVLPLDTFILEDGTFELEEGATFATNGPIAITGGDGAQNVIIRGVVNGGVALGGGNDQMTVAGTVNGDIDLGDGDDQFTGLGLVTANVNLGDGNDIATIDAGATLEGQVDGGAGTDRLSIATPGTFEEPFAVDALAASGFEELEARGGYNIATGALTYDRIIVSAGQLFGQAGSNITAPDIIVAAGATFGSAGTVTGNVQVNGTMAPGASPGTTSIVGNLSLGSTSNTLFELSTTVNDLLLVSEQLTIASGATLTLTGDRPLTPGSSLDLIVADGGITGSFSTINKAATIGGFVAQRGNRVQLLGQFAVSPTANPQIARTISYANTLLLSGQADPALLGAIPQLLNTDGSARESAFAQLNAEAYASAMQIAFEGGRATASSLRSPLAADDAKGAFVFARAVGHWRDFGGNAARGVSEANVRHTGVLGGIGVTGEGSSLAAIIGHLSGRQQIKSIGSTSDSDGLTFGVVGQADLGKLRTGVSITYANLGTDTKRAVPTSTAQSHYKLRSLTADVHVAADLAVGGGWTLSPTLALMSQVAYRNDASETGSAAFGLDVVDDVQRAAFAEVSVKIGRDVASGGLSPWLSLGLSKRLMASDNYAEAGAAGVGDTFFSEGVAMRKSHVTAGAGVSAKVNERLFLNAAWQGAFAGGNKSNNLTAGLSFRF